MSTNKNRNVKTDFLDVTQHLNKTLALILIDQLNLAVKHELQNSKLQTIKKELLKEY